jgi:hypothetical protein
VRRSAFPSILLIGAIALGVGTHHANAQSITWGDAQNIADAIQVQNTGTLLDAGYVGPNPANDTTLTVNGVDFRQFNYPASPATTTYGHISVNYSLHTVGFNNYATGAAPTGTNYAAILTGALYHQSSSGMTVTLSGLLADHTYRVQYWANQPNPGANNSSGAYLSGTATRMLVGDVNGPTGGHPGQYVIGTFTTDSLGSNVSFTYSTGANVNYAIIDAITLFDITGVPEPSTWIGGAMAAAVFAWSQRRIFRRKTH